MATRRQWVAAAGAAVIGVGVLAPWSQAADIPTFGVDPLRDRTVNSTALVSRYIYPTPFYVPVAGQESFSTPVVVGTNLYQYTFTAAGQGTLWVFPMSSPPTACFATGQTCETSWAPSQVYTWTPGVVNGINEAGGVSSPTIAHGYTAIAVGPAAYSWPTGAAQSAEQQIRISGNPGQQINQIDMAPLITPPLQAQGINESTGALATWQSPYAVVGSWNGGLVAYPTDVPPGVQEFWHSYQTYDDFHQTGAFLTSSPTWDAALNRVVFGVAVPSSSGHHPRVVVFDPTTGNHTYFGVGTIRASVDSSVVIGPNGNFYVPDQAGGVYEFTPSGQLVAQNQQFAEVNALNISDLAVSPHAVYAVGRDLSVLAALNPTTLATQWVNSQLGTGLFSPSVVNNGTTDAIFLAGPNKVYELNQNGTPYQAAGSPTPAWVSVVADAGPNHWLATWTNSDPLHHSALEIWEPMAYSVTGWTSAQSVLPGQALTLYAVPSPPGVTQRVDAAIPNASGTSTQSITLQANQTNWTATFTAPTTPGTYTIPITATSVPDAGLTQTQAVQATTTVTITVLPGVQGPTAANGDLTLQSYGLANLTHQHPAGTSQLGDTVVATLTIPLSQFTVTGGTVTDATLTQATLTQPLGVEAFTATSNSSVTTRQDPMTTQGLTATTKFVENWSGYPPPVPPATSTWAGTLTAHWTVSGHFTTAVPEQICTGPNACTTTTVSTTEPFTVHGTSSAPLTVTGTDWFVIPQATVENP